MSAPPAARRAPRALAAPSATLWGSIRHELLFLSFALMEIGLLTPVVLVVLGWARYWPPFHVAVWLLLVMLLPLNLIRLMSLLQFDIKQQRWALMAGLLLLVVLSWRLLLYSAASPLDFGWLRVFAANLALGGSLIWTRDLSIFLLTAFFWWRGIRLAQRVPEINNTGLRLRLGGLILAPLVVWFGGSFLERSVVSFVLLFFLAALTAVSLVRAENIEQERSGMAATLNARWFAVVFAAALLVVLAAGVAGAFLAGDALPVVIGWLSPLWRALQFGATVAGVTLFDLASPLLDALAVAVQFLAAILARLLGLMSATLRESGLLAGVATPELPTLTPEATPAGPAFAGRAMTTLVMLGLIALIALALGRAYRQATFAARDSARSRAAADAEDGRPGPARRALERLGLLRQWRAAASVRRVYRLMCRAAAAAGYPRLGAETPYEYLPTLAGVWPDHAAETRLITEAFVRVRYGEVPETEDELEAIRAAWRRLEVTPPHTREPAAEAGPMLVKRE